MSNEAFANPQPPSNYSHPHQSREDTSHLSNDDFRKLLMTPSASSFSRAGGGGGLGGEKGMSSGGAGKTEMNSSKKKFANEAAERRKEKKLYYASLMKEVKEREAELAQKYRDRAKERRENKTNEADFVSTTQNFKTVAPEFSLVENAERRRQIIEESKFLGGDLEHTHLVKGLDYALLQKIKAELEKKQDDLDLEEKQDPNNKGKEQNEMDEKEVGGSDDDDDEEADEETSKPVLKPKIVSKSDNAAIASALTKSFKDNTGLKKNLELVKQSNKVFQKNLKAAQENEDDYDETKVVFKTKLARNIYRVQFESQPPKVVDLFLPNRMAYVVDLNDEETDVPITCMRSKADCPNNESNTSLTTNDIVINKLTQILSYLRHGKRDVKKNKKKLVKSGEETEEKILGGKIDSANNFSIYDDIGDYVPTLTKSDAIKKKEIEDKKRNYFGSQNEDEKEQFQGPTQEAANEFIKNINEKYSNKEIEPKKDEKKSTGMSVKFDSDSYSECYPGTRAEEDVNIDSDEEVDFSKMDLGNKKGPGNKWDFENNEESKAGFQFGIPKMMADGKKTKPRLPGDDTKKLESKNKVKLDKEWTQISRLIDKRKQGGSSGLGESKKIKY